MDLNASFSFTLRPSVSSYVIPSLNHQYTLVQDSRCSFGDGQTKEPGTNYQQIVVSEI
jgi:hypothetical protein